MLNFSKSLNDFIKAFLKNRGLPFKEFKIHPIAGDGSKRLFIRIITPYPGNTFVVMINFPSNEYLNKENLAYLMINKHLFKKGLPVPEIYRFDLTNGWFIVQDMGDRSLQDKALNNKNRMVLYEKTLDILFRLQIEGVLIRDGVVRQRYMTNSLCAVMKPIISGIPFYLTILE
jgi:hypothetical protein